MFLVCERWAGDRDRLLFWSKVLLSSIAALLPHLGLVAQLWVTEGQRPLPAASSQFGILSPTGSNSNWLKPSMFWLYFCLTPNCFRCSPAYLNRCISWLTARSRVNMLHNVVCSVGCGIRIHQMLLCFGVRPLHNEFPKYDTKQPDGEVPVMQELCINKNCTLDKL